MKQLVKQTKILGCIFAFVLFSKELKAGSGNNQKVEIFVPDQLDYIETDSAGNFVHRMRLDFSQFGMLTISGTSKKVKAFATYFSEQDRSIGYDTFNISFSKESFKIDAEMLLNLRSTVQQLTIKTKSEGITFPRNLCTDSDFDDAEINCKYFFDTQKVLDSKYEISNLKVKSSELITLGGVNITNSYKITSKLRISVKEKSKNEFVCEEPNKLTLWVSPVYGVLKVEERTKKNKLLRKLTLTL